MKKHAFILTLFGFLYLSSQLTFSQISEGGTPLSFSIGIETQKEKIPVFAMPSVNAKEMIEAYVKERAENDQIPFKFGHAMDVDIDIKKDGFKKELPNGDKLWLLKIHCPEAFSINLI